MSCHSPKTNHSASSPVARYPVGEPSGSPLQIPLLCPQLGSFVGTSKFDPAVRVTDAWMVAARVVSGFVVQPGRYLVLLEMQSGRGQREVEMVAGLAAVVAAAAHARKSGSWSQSTAQHRD